MWTGNNTENKNSLSKHRKTVTGKRTPVASVSSEEKSVTRMFVIYDSAHLFVEILLENIRQKIGIKGIVNR